jgi:hypothetical protein
LQHETVGLHDGHGLRSFFKAFVFQYLIDQFLARIYLISLGFHFAAWQ